MKNFKTAYAEKVQEAWDALSESEQEGILNLTVKDILEVVSDKDTMRGFATSLATSFINGLFKESHERNVSEAPGNAYRGSLW